MTDYSLIALRHHYREALGLLAHIADKLGVPRGDPAAVLAAIDKLTKENRHV